MRLLSLFTMLIFSNALAGVIGDPFSGVPISINGTPGGLTYFEAENFDKGGEGIAFHDPFNCSTTPCNCLQSGYRPDGVNVCAAGAVTFVSNTGPGLWVEYTIQVAALGGYTLELLVAFNDAACCAAAAYHVELDGAVVTKSIALGPALTGGWQSYDWRGKSGLIGMQPGIHHLRIVVDHGFFNWDSIRVKYAGGFTNWQWVPIWKDYP